MTWRVNLAGVNLILKLVFFFFRVVVLAESVLVGGFGVAGLGCLSGRYAFETGLAFCGRGVRAFGGKS